MFTVETFHAGLQWYGKFPLMGFLFLTDVICLVGYLTAIRSATLTSGLPFVSLLFYALLYREVYFFEGEWLILVSVHVLGQFIMPLFLILRIRQALSPYIPTDTQLLTQIRIDYPTQNADDWKSLSFLDQFRIYMYCSGKHNSQDNDMRWHVHDIFANREEVYSALHSATGDLPMLYMFGLLATMEPNKCALIKADVRERTILETSVSRLRSRFSRRSVRQHFEVLLGAVNEKEFVKGRVVYVE